MIDTHSFHSCNAILSYFYQATEVTHDLPQRLEVSKVISDRMAAACYIYDRVSDWYVKQLVIRRAIKKKELQ
jgi:hypothetical protein